MPRAGTLKPTALRRALKPLCSMPWRRLYAALYVLPQQTSALQAEPVCWRKGARDAVTVWGRRPAPIPHDEHIQTSVHNLVNVGGAAVAYAGFLGLASSNAPEALEAPPLSKCLARCDFSGCSDHVWADAEEVKDVSKGNPRPKEITMQKTCTRSPPPPPP